MHVFFIIILCNIENMREPGDEASKHAWGVGQAMECLPLRFGIGNSSKEDLSTEFACVHISIDLL